MRSIIIILLAVVVSGCSIPVKLTAEPGAGQQLVYRDGNPSVLSEKKNSVMLMAQPAYFKADPSADGKAKFVIAVQNREQESLDLTPSNISADCQISERIKKIGKEESKISLSGIQSIFGISDANAATPESDQDLYETITSSRSLKIFSYSELLSEEKSRQSGEMFVTALVGVATAATAQSTGYSRSGYSGTSYNPHLAQAAQNNARSQTASDFARIKAEGAARENELTRTTLQHETVAPGAVGGGIVVIAIPKPEDIPIPVDIRVQLAGETHAFRYIYEKVKK